MNSERLSDIIVSALDDIKAQDIVKLDVRDLTTVTDFMIIASGTSNRHVKALVDNVAEKAREAGRKPIGVEGEDGSEWVLPPLWRRGRRVPLRSARRNWELSKDTQPWPSTPPFSCNRRLRSAKA